VISIGYVVAFAVASYSPTIDFQFEVPSTGCPGNTNTFTGTVIPVYASCSLFPSRENPE
jgi:hypothetical protein